MCTATQGAYTLLTGASSGIGESLAITMSRDHDLILNGRDADRLQSTVRRSSRPEAHYVWPCDLADPAAASESLNDFISTQHFRVSNFVHCAGVVHLSPIRHTALEQMFDLFSVNLFSVVAILRVLMLQRSGPVHLRNVLIISSAAALLGEKGVALYSASKGAVNALVEALAAELAPAVRVNAILPGLVKTPMSESTIRSADFADQVGPKYPLGVGETGDVVNLAMYLLSSRARWVTGALWVIDGGRTTS
jgi:NAD(P)-dependent dehydrogenase (short-subunit alcohol dehydrogenase family)